MEEERPVCLCNRLLGMNIGTVHTYHQSTYIYIYPHLQEKKKNGPGRDISRLLDRLLDVHVDTVHTYPHPHPDLQEKKKGPGRDISRLLNRLLGVHVDKQRNIFSYFMLLLVRFYCSGGEVPDLLRKPPCCHAPLEPCLCTPASSR